MSKTEMIEQIIWLLGGRASEELILDDISTGASNDIERATASARSMVSIYGMSERFDMMALESVQNRYLDGRAVRNCSEETSTLLDDETLKIIKLAHENARKILRENRDLLDKISEVLLEKETIFGDEFFNIVYEKYPEMKEEKEKEKSENEKRVKELQERRAKKNSLDTVIDDKAGISSQKAETDIINPAKPLAESQISDDKDDGLNKSADLENKNNESENNETTW